MYGTKNLRAERHQTALAGTADAAPEVVQGETLTPAPAKKPTKKKARKK